MSKFDNRLAHCFPAKFSRDVWNGLVRSLSATRLTFTFDKHWAAGDPRPPVVAREATGCGLNLYSNWVDISSMFSAPKFLHPNLDWSFARFLKNDLLPFLPVEFHTSEFFQTQKSTSVFCFLECHSAIISRNIFEKCWQILSHCCPFLTSRFAVDCLAFAFQDHKRSGDSIWSK